MGKVDVGVPRQVMGAAAVVSVGGEVRLVVVSCNVLGGYLCYTSLAKAGA